MKLVSLLFIAAFVTSNADISAQDIQNCFTSTAVLISDYNGDINSNPELANWSYKCLQNVYDNLKDPAPAPERYLDQLRIFLSTSRVLVDIGKMITSHD